MSAQNAGAAPSQAALCYYVCQFNSPSSPQKKGGQRIA